MDCAEQQLHRYTRYDDDSQWLFPMTIAADELPSRSLDVQHAKQRYQGLVTTHSTKPRWMQSIVKWNRRAVIGCSRIGIVEAAGVKYALLSAATRIQKSEYWLCSRPMILGLLLVFRCPKFSTLYCINGSPQDCLLLCWPD
jgi:hypothetical protein